MTRFERIIIPKIPKYTVTEKIDEYTTQETNFTSFKKAVRYANKSEFDYIEIRRIRPGGYCLQSSNGDLTIVENL